MVSTQRIPPFRAIPFLRPEQSADTFLLTEQQREELANIGLRQRLPPRTVIYREGDTAHWVFAVTDGVVKSYRDLRSGRRVVSAFLFSRDLFGLAANGRYVNAVQTIARSTVYRLPVAELAILLKQHSDMQFAFLSKLTHELRESQRRAILVTRRDASGRLAMFIAQMGERLDRDAAGLVPLPMSRSDIAAFTGLSLESVSRAAADLQRRQLVAFEGRHLARILDPAGFARLTGAI
jgi:CRP/FNR family transcriptional regulator